MKKLFLLLTAVVLLTPALAAAQDVLNGTWKVDLNKVDFGKKPEVYVLQNGMYECKTCVPTFKVKADGTDQPVTGHPYFDSITIKEVSDHSIEQTYKKAGKVVGTSTMTVSPDGKTATSTFVDSSNTNNGAPVTGKETAKRVAAGPAGSHAISGSWLATQVQDVSENGLTWTYKVGADGLTMTSPMGQTFTAKLDGSEAPMKGDPGITTVSVKMIGKDTLEETDKRDGKVVGISRMTVAPDGKSARIVFEDKIRNDKMEFTVVKQ